MKVSELAKEYNTTVDHVINILKTLKLKAKDGSQELNAVVLSVVKSHLEKNKVALPQKAAEVKDKADKKKEEKAVSTIVVKKAVAKEVKIKDKEIKEVKKE